MGGAMTVARGGWGGGGATRLPNPVPEAVVVAERGDDGTVLKRLEPERLTEWLERYTLGDLWAMGELGGNL